MVGSTLLWGVHAVSGQERSKLGLFVKLIAVTLSKPPLLFWVLTVQWIFHVWMRDVCWHYSLLFAHSVTFTSHYVCTLFFYFSTTWTTIHINYHLSSMDILQQARPIKPTTELKLRIQYEISEYTTAARWNGIPKGLMHWWSSCHHESYAILILHARHDVS